MIPKFKKILFASDLSTQMMPVFEHAASLAVYSQADLIVLHVMEEAGNSSERQVRAAFGEDLYRDLKNKHKTGAKNILIGKNSDAVKIKQAISEFFQGTSERSDESSPIEKILVAESRSTADEIVSTAVDQDCSLIVMGCRQQGLLAEAMGGKLVRKVLRRTSVPVFVVPVSEK